MSGKVSNVQTVEECRMRYHGRTMRRCSADVNTEKVGLYRVSIYVHIYI